MHGARSSFQTILLSTPNLLKFHFFREVKIIVFTINYKNIKLFLLFVKKMYTADVR